MTPKEIKQDLRALSKKAQCISTLLQAIDVHHKCSELAGTQQSERQLESIMKSLERNIEDFTRLEVEYMRYIARLEPTQKVVLIDHYINAEPLWRTANKFGYTDRHLCRYINEAVLNIAEMTGYKK